MLENLISVIVPVYNVELYLKRCVDSILEQTYKNLEIILVDDGSTDNSGVICNTYAQVDNRIKVIHKKNGGLSDARNKGLDIANGKYVSFIDSDDWIEKSMYLDCISSLERYKANIIICRRYRAYDDKRKNIEEYKRYPLNCLMSTEDALSNFMTFSGFDMSFCDKIFERRLLFG